MHGNHKDDYDTVVIINVGYTTIAKNIHYKDNRVV